MSVWYVILQHEDKNVMAELIWRVLIATIKTPIHISQSKFSFHNKRSLKHTIIGRAKRAPHWGVQSRFHVISRNIYIYVVGMSEYVCRMSN